MTTSTVSRQLNLFSCPYVVLIYERNVNTNRTYVKSKSIMDTITIVGLIAAAFTTVALLPQLIKVWKTKSTKDISMGMFTLFSVGVFLWFVYGVYLSDIPIILANSLAFIQAFIILIFKVKYK